MFNLPVCATRARRNVSLVDDHEIRSIAQECVAMAAPIGLYKIDARDKIRIVSINRNILARALAFEARHLRGLDQHGLNRKFFLQFPLPLIAEMRRRQHADSSRYSPIQ